VSAVVPLTIYDLVNVRANAILFDPYGQSLYATVPSNATGIAGNSVVAIDPFTGEVGTPVAVGSQPTVMAETTDGNYLYVGLSGADSLAQFNLLNQSLTATIPITLTQGTTSTTFAASWLAAMPGTDTTLAINEPNEGGTFGIFDITGSTGAFRPNFSGIYAGDNPVFASPTELYAYDDQTTGAEFYRYSINANGVTLIDGTTLDGMGGFGGLFELENGLVYGGGGGIVNPSTTPPSQIQTLPLIDFYGSGAVGASSGLAADPSLEKEFLMLENLAGTLAYGLVRYNLNTYLPESVLEMPQALTADSPLMQRFGQDGLALVADENTSDTTVAQVLLLRGPFIAPQELSIGATAASLTSSSSPSLTHGAGNTTLTLTGSNFLPGVAVTWNGSYRTTTVVSSTQVTVDLPASDLASAGSASLVATNPGAPASNTLTITIN
jgi:trimeric autotransporter adhesin